MIGLAPKDWLTIGAAICIGGAILVQIVRGMGFTGIAKPENRVPAFAMVLLLLAGVLMAGAAQLMT